MKKRFVSRICGFLRANSVREGWRCYCSVNNGPMMQVHFGKDEKWHKDFCADPFLFFYDGSVYLFYETVDANGKGMIGCFKQEDIGGWRNLGKVLEENFHLSYPQVFQVGESIYMLPESSDSGRGAVFLYQAVEFPVKWKRIMTLIDRPFADATLLSHRGHWYMACYRLPPDEGAELWHSESLTGVWRRHPMWNKISQSPRLRRNGGMFIKRDGRVFRIAQDCNGMYGKRLFAVPVAKINPLEYDEGCAEIFWDRSMFPYKCVHTYNELQIGSVRMSVIDAHVFLKPVHQICMCLFQAVIRRVKRLLFK